MDHADLEATLKKTLAGQGSGIVAVYLFGSVARGTAGPDSDIDVAVLYERPPAPRLDAGPVVLEGELERALRHRVDVVALNQAPVDLAIRVMREGRLIVENNRSARIRFEVRTRNLFFDLEPILRRYRERERSPM